MENSKFYDILCKYKNDLVDTFTGSVSYPMSVNDGEDPIEFILRCIKGSSARAKHFKEKLQRFIVRVLDKKDERVLKTKILKNEEKERITMDEEDVLSSRYERELLIKANEARRKAKEDAELKAKEDQELKTKRIIAEEKERKMMGQEDKLAKTKATNLKTANLRQNILTLPTELKQSILGFIDTKLSEKDKQDLKELYTSTDYYSELLNLVAYNPMEVKIPKKYSKQAEKVVSDEVYPLKSLIEKIYLDGTGEEIDPEKDGLYYEDIGGYGDDMTFIGFDYDADAEGNYTFDSSYFEKNVDKIVNRFLPNIRKEIMDIGKKVLKPDLPKSVVKAREKAVQAKDAEIKAVQAKILPKDAPFGLTKSGKVRTKPLGSKKKEKTGLGVIGGGFIEY